MTVNDQIFDATVQHQIAVNNAANDTAKRALDELATFDRQVLNNVNRFDPGETNRGLDAVVRRVEESERDLSVGLFDLILADLLSVAEEEEEFNELLLIPLALSLNIELQRPKLSDIRRKVRTSEFSGGLIRLGTAKEHIDEFARRRARQISDELRLGRLGSLSSGQIIRNIRGTRAQRFRNGILQKLRNDLKSISLGAIVHASNTASGVFSSLNKTFFNEVWIAILDGNTCPICAARHNRRFKIGEGPQPPAHPNCRCIRMKTLKIGGAFKSPKFDDWLRAQPESVVVQALGPTRAKLFLRGRLPIERFVANPFRRTNSTRVLTIEELRASDSRTIQEAFRKAGLVT